VTDPYVHPTAVVDEGATLGAGARIWHFCHVMTGARIGPDVSIGQNGFVARGVTIGRGSKLQNNVSLYEGVELGEDVFCGPSCVFTNVVNPRAEIARRDAYQRTVVGRGATLGANATIVCGTTLGRYAFVAAGAVVVRGSYPDYALLIGNPARRRGWMSRHGHRLETKDAAGNWVCPESGWRYQERDGILRCLDRDEEAPLGAAR
jgi:UDP-2-acetamido-3-amino-2,3-dideoxy-glucuronate N-acetyltransferase